MTTEDTKPRVGQPGSGVPFRAGDDSRRNKGGRPRKIPEEAAESFRALVPEACQVLARLMRQKKAPSVSLGAVATILERAFGKAATIAEISGPNGQALFPPDANSMSTFERTQRIAFSLRLALDEKKRLAATPSDSPLADSTLIPNGDSRNE